MVAHVKAESLLLQSKEGPLGELLHRDRGVLHHAVAHLNRAEQGMLTRVLFSSRIDDLSENPLEALEEALARVRAGRRVK
jgi:hypothetical protein